MPATRVKARRRRKYCPVCGKEVPMTVIREAADENDLWWLLCPSCDSKFALTHREYQKEKRPNISAIDRSNATVYRTDQTYSIGEVVYHSKLEDIGLVVSKSDSPLASCSGTITVSFMKIGQKTLIEGYVAT